MDPIFKSPNSKNKITQNEENHYKSEFLNLCKPKNFLTIDEMKNFLNRLKLSDHDIRKIFSYAVNDQKNITLESFIYCMRLCSLIKQGKKYSQQDCFQEQKFLGRRTKFPAGTSQKDQISPMNQLNSAEKLSQNLKKFTKISIKPPVLVQSGWFGSGSYYTYQINSIISQQSYSVIRRFSDLDWLHSYLQTNYKGFIVPPLPEKKILSVTDKNFIDQRRIDMEKYLICISEHDVLCESKGFFAFLTLLDKEFQSFREKSEDFSEVFEVKGIEDTFDKTMATIQTKFNIFTSNNSVNIESSIQNIIEKNSKINNNYHSLLLSFQVWVKSQQSENNLIFGIIRAGENSIKIDILIQNQEESIEKLKKYEEIIQNQYVKSQGLAEALKIYQESKNNLNFQNNLLNRKLKKQRKCNDETQNSIYIKKIQEIQNSISGVEKEITEIENNLKKEFNELENFKNENFFSIIQGIINSQNACYKNVSVLWKEINNN